MSVSLVTLLAVCAVCLVLAVRGGRLGPRLLRLPQQGEQQVKTINEYAIELVTDGAESVAEDDLNEDGDIAEDEHEEACDLAIEMAHAIKNNPEAFLAWFQSMRPVTG